MCLRPKKCLANGFFFFGWFESSANRLDRIQMTNKKTEQNKTKRRQLPNNQKWLKGKNSDLLMSSRLSTGDFQINIYGCRNGFFKYDSWISLSNNVSYRHTEKLWFLAVFCNRSKRTEWILLTIIIHWSEDLRMACILAQDFVTLNDVPMHVKHTSVLLYIYIYIVEMHHCMTILAHKLFI